jgi:zinc protease
MVRRPIAAFPAQPAIPAQRIRPQEPDAARAAHRDAVGSARRADRLAALLSRSVVRDRRAGESAALDVLAQLMGGAPTPTSTARW